MLSISAVLTSFRLLWLLRKESISLVSVGLLTLRSTCPCRVGFQSFGLSVQFFHPKYYICKFLEDTLRLQLATTIDLNKCQGSWLSGDWRCWFNYCDLVDICLVILLQDLLLKPKYLLTLTVGLKQKDFVNQCVQKVCFWNLQEYIFRSCLPCDLFNKGLGFRGSSFFNYEGCRVNYK